MVNYVGCVSCGKIWRDNKTVDEKGVVLKKFCCDICRVVREFVIVNYITEKIIDNY